MTFLARWMDGDHPWPRGCWPNEPQRLLLQACLLEDDAAATRAWQKWEALVPWDFIDFGSHRLLLLLHDRLRRLGLTSKDQGRLAGVARYYWVQTELRQRQAIAILQLFENAQIPTLLLKGAALNATVYRTGFRAMNDLDVAVRREDAPRAVQLLNEADAAPPKMVSDESFRFGHGTNFSLADGTEIDLHWDFFHSRSLSPDQQQTLWDASLPVKIGPASSRVLCPADQLLHTCEHGVRYNETPPFRWLADAFQLIRAAGSDLDWLRLATQARECNAVLQVRRSLQWLNENLDLPIPDEALADLDESKMSLADRLEYRVAGQRGLAGQHTFWQTFPEHAFAWYREGRPGSLAKYHCLQHNISQNHGARWLEFTKLGVLQTASRVKAAVPSIGKVRRFVVSTLPDDEIIGCHEVERSGHRTFRWTSGESSLVVTLPPGQYDVDVHVFPWRDWGSDLASELRVDFNRNGCLVTPVGNRNRVLRFSIQRDMFGSAPQQRLTFRCGSFRNVPEDEKRHLGLPLKTVCFRPRKSGGTES